MAQHEERKYLTLWIKTKPIYLSLKNVQDSLLFYFFFASSFTSMSTKACLGNFSTFQIHSASKFLLSEVRQFEVCVLQCYSLCYLNFILHPTRLRWLKKFPLGKEHIKMHSRQAKYETCSISNQQAEYCFHIDVQGIAKWKQTGKTDFVFIKLATYWFLGPRTIFIKVDIFIHIIFPLTLIQSGNIIIMDLW